MANPKPKTALGWVLHVLPAVVYTTLIFVGGTLPQGPDTGLEFEHQDKLLHLLAFAGLQFLAWRAVRYLFPARAALWHIGWGIAVSVLSGTLLEVWQSFLPTREAELLDLVADALGALLSALVLRQMLRSKRASLAG